MCIKLVDKGQECYTHEETKAIKNQQSEQKWIDTLQNILSRLRKCVYTYLSHGAVQNNKCATNRRVNPINFLKIEYFSWLLLANICQGKGVFQ